MQTQIPLLQDVRVASPCDASWEGMEAIDGERVKFCLHCAKNVYNLSEMSQAEAEGLLRKHEGRLCVRYYQRQDGTVLTRDCPIGAQAVRMNLIRRSTVAASLFVMLFGAMAAISISDNSSQDSAVEVPITGKIAVEPPAVPLPVATEQPVLKPLPTDTNRPTALMGEVAPTPMMGAVAPPRTIMGKMRRPEIKHETVIQVPDKPHDYDSAQVQDSTDGAILKPRK